jgi:hypothetical protein
MRTDGQAHVAGVNPQKDETVACCRSQIEQALARCPSTSLRPCSATLTAAEDAPHPAEALLAPRPRNLQ